MYMPGPAGASNELAVGGWHASWAGGVCAACTCLCRHADPTCALYPGAMPPLCVCMVWGLMAAPVYACVTTVYRHMYMPDGCIHRTGRDLQPRFTLAGMLQPLQHPAAGLQERGSGTGLHG
jgi:hypothetical protein